MIEIQDLNSRPPPRFSCKRSLHVQEWNSVILLLRTWTLRFFWYLSISVAARDHRSFENLFILFGKRSMKCAKVHPIFNDIRFFPFNGILMELNLNEIWDYLWLCSSNSIVELCVGVLHFKVLVGSFLCKEAVRWKKNNFNPKQRRYLVTKVHPRGLWGNIGRFCY